MSLILSLLAAVATSGQTAQPPIVRVPMLPPAMVSPSPSRPVSDQDRAIVDLMVPHDTFISGHIKAFVVTFDTANANDPATQKLFADNPGLRAALLAAAEPEMTRIFEADYPGLRERIAQVVADSLLPGDYASVLAFLGSSAAVKSRAAARSDGSRKLMADRAVANGGKGFTSGDTAALAASVTRETLQALTPAEASVIAQFSSSPPGRRFVLAHQRAGNITLEWANGLTARSGPVTEAITLAAEKFFRNEK